VDDGSTDRTAAIVKSFGTKIKGVTTENRGLSSAVNTAIRLSNGDYIQELDSDDLLVPDKIERQLAALREGDSKRVLLSSPLALFFYRTRGARFIHNSLCQDLAPVEWMLIKMSENLFMQNATWLVSRELVEAAGPWDIRLHYDQDGEYFARVLQASEYTRFVPGTGVYYRASGSHRVSYIGNSDKKKDSLLLAMKLQIQYIRSLEDSERVHKACLTYLQNWYPSFYPGRPDLIAEVKSLATALHGQLKEPVFRWKYAWLEPLFGRNAADWAQRVFPHIRHQFVRQCDKTLHKLESHLHLRAMPESVGCDSSDTR
jgi:glycosyltransferase involved in cell wall biosynthesis